MGISFVRFNRRESLFVSDFDRKDVAHLGALKKITNLAGAVEIAATTAENLAISMHSVVHTTFHFFKEVVLG